MWQGVLALAAGVPVGLQLGVTGTGGALLAVPVLVYIAGFPVQQAAATSLVVVAAVAWIGIWEYGRQGLVRARAAAALSWTGIIGSWAGAYGHRLVPHEVLLITFGVMLLVARSLMVKYQSATAVGPDESCAVRFPRSCWLKMAGIGLVIGLLNGFFGVGGGFMIVPALVLLLGFPARLAIGTSLSVIALMSLGGILGHWQFGDIDARLTVMVAMGSAAGILAGARLGNVLSPAVVRRVTAFVTVTIATFLITINSLKLLGWPHE